MIDLRQTEILITEGLQAYLDIVVALSNSTSKKSDYPYVSYTITTSKEPKKGTWGSAGEKHTNEFYQVWSITIQSDDDTEAYQLAHKAQTWFELTGVQFLVKNNIGIGRIGNITNRSNLLTIEYEYRYGFDVRLRLQDAIHEIGDDKFD